MVAEMERPPACGIGNIPPAGPGARVENGQVAAPHSYPWMVYIEVTFIQQSSSASGVSEVVLQSEGSRFDPRLLLAEW